MSLPSLVIQKTLHQVLSCFFTHKIDALDQFEVLFFMKRTHCKKTRVLIICHLLEAFLGVLERFKVAFR